MACPQPNMEESRNFTKPEEYRLYVTNLPVELNKEGIKEIFDHYGKIIGLFYRPNATWTFVTYRTYREAEYALRDLHDKPPLYLKVSFGKEKANDEIREEKPQDKKPTAMYEHLIQHSLYNSKPHIQTMSRGKRINAFYKERLGSRLPSHKCAPDNLLYPVPTDPYTYDPYEDIEPYGNPNALWTRGTVTVTRDGKRHVSHGRGYTSYEIPDPDPQVETLINQIHGKRFNELYEHGQDMLKNRIGQCHRCIKQANLKCERCHCFYCSRECQIADWPYHRNECRKMPGLIKDKRSSSSSTNEEKEPTLSLPQTPKTLRRPKRAVSSLLHKQTKETTNQSTSITYPEVCKEENFQKDHQTDNATKMNDDTSKLSTIERDNTKQMGRISSSEALNIEEDISFRKEPFLSTTHFSHVKIVAVEKKGIYWVNRCRDKQAITRMLNDLNDMIMKMPKIKPIIGNICAYKFDNLWHRVRVISHNPTKIFFIDFGATNTVTDDNFRKTNLGHVPPYAKKICLPENIEELLGTVECDDVLVVKAVTYTKDYITVEVKSKQARSNVFESDSSTNKGSSTPKMFLTLPNVLDHLSENTSGFLAVQTTIRNNVYGVILIPEYIFDETKLVLDKLNRLCEGVKPLDVQKISVGQLVCAKGKDGHWFRGCILTLQPLQVAKIDETTIISTQDIVPCPSEVLNISKLGVVCEVSTDNVKLKVGGNYTFKVKSCTDKIKIEVTADDKNKVEAVLKMWEPNPQQSGIKLHELKNGSEVCITAYHTPSKLYVRSLQIEDVEAYNKIMQDGAKCAQSAPNLLEPPLVGEMVLAQYIDDNFYRAIVTKVEEDEIKVSYIDYGNGENISLKKLKVLPADLKLRPSCAAKVILKGVPSDAVMIKDLSEYFIYLTGREIPLICNFNGIPSEDGVFLTTANGENVNDKVKQLLTPSWKKENKKDEPIYTITDVEPAKLESGYEINVIVLRTIKEGVMYVMCPFDIDLISNVLDVMPPLMNEYCKKAEYYIPRHNELCLGLYDGNWYRGLCVDDTSCEDKCQIFFLDYGNTEFVLHKNIRAITKSFLTPSTLSNICTVVNLAETDEDGNISPRILKRITELVNTDDVIVIKIIETEPDGCHKIELPEVRAQLVKEGLI